MLNLSKKVFLSSVVASLVVSSSYAISGSVWIDNSATVKPQDSIKIGKMV